MSGFTWPLPTPTPTTTPTATGGGQVQGFRQDLPAVRENRAGTLSWLLVNLAGTVDMRPGEMDVLWLNGTIREITEGIQVLDQRVRKSVAEVQGENEFAPGWGSIVAEFVGEKILSVTTLREIGQSVSEMFDELINLQAETANRLDLEPAELIDSVSAINVTANGTFINVRVTIITQAQTVEEILLPGVLNVVQN